MEATTDTTIPTPRRLSRARDGRHVGGVAAGLGHYFDLNPAIYRIAFVALALAGGTGILLYLAAWPVIPTRTRGVLIAERAAARAPGPPGARDRSRPARLRARPRALGGALLADARATSGSRSRSRRRPRLVGAERAAARPPAGAASADPASRVPVLSRGVALGSRRRLLARSGSSARSTRPAPRTSTGGSCSPRARPARRRVSSPPARRPACGSAASSALGLSCSRRSRSACPSACRSSPAVATAPSQPAPRLAPASTYELGIGRLTVDLHDVRLPRRRDGTSGRRSASATCSSIVPRERDGRGRRPREARRRRPARTRGERRTRPRARSPTGRAGAACSCSTRASAIGKIEVRARVS